MLNRVLVASVLAGSVVAAAPQAQSAVNGQVTPAPEAAPPVTLRLDARASDPRRFRVPAASLAVRPDSKTAALAVLVRSVHVRPRVVGGMVVLEGDADLDPGIRVRVPDDGVEHRIRRVTPTVCVE